MLDLRRFGRRSEPTKLETPCFWYQFLVSGVHNLDTSFWYQKLGRRTWVVCHPPNKQTLAVKHKPSRYYRTDGLIMVNRRYMPAGHVRNVAVHLATSFNSSVVPAGASMFAPLYVVPGKRPEYYSRSA